MITHPLTLNHFFIHCNIFSHLSTHICVLKEIRFGFALSGLTVFRYKCKLFPFPQALYPRQTSVGVSSSHAKTVACVRAITMDSDAFARNKAKTGACTAARPAQLHFQAAMTTNARMVGSARPCLSTASTLTPASALLASQVPGARLLLSSHSSPEVTCT